MSWRKPASEASAVCWRYSRATPTSSCRFSIRPRASIVRSASRASSVPVFSRHPLEELVDRELLRQGHQGLHRRVEAADRAARGRGHTRRLRIGQRLPERATGRLRVGHEARERGVADPASGAVRDPQERPGVARVDEHASGTRSRRGSRRARRSEGRRSPGTARPAARARPRARGTARSSGRRPRSRSPRAPGRSAPRSRPRRTVPRRARPRPRRRAPGRPRRGRRRGASASARVFCSMTALAARRIGFVER